MLDYIELFCYFQAQILNLEVNTEYKCGNKKILQDKYYNLCHISFISRSFHKMRKHKCARFYYEKYLCRFRLGRLLWHVV